MVATGNHNIENSLRSATPPGEAEGQLRKLDSFNEQLSCAGLRAADFTALTDGFFLLTR